MHTINSYCTNHIISFSRLQSLCYLASFNQYDVSLSTPNHINYKHQGNSATLSLISSFGINIKIYSSWKLNFHLYKDYYHWQRTHFHTEL